MTRNSSLHGLPAVPVPALPPPSERAALRKKFGVTQVILARTLRISRKTLWTWETGTAEPTGAKRDEYAAILAAWQAHE